MPEVADSPRVPSPPTGATQSLQRRIVISVLLGLGVVLIGLGYLVTLAFDHARDAALHERLAVAEAKQHELTQEIEDALSFLERLGRDLPPDLREAPPASQRRVLDHILADSNATFAGIAIVRPSKGTVTAAGDLSWQQSLRSSWPQVPLVDSGGPGVFEIDGQPPALGLAAPVASGEEPGTWIVAELRSARLKRHLASGHLGGGMYGAEVMSSDGRMVIVSPDRRLPSGAHAALVADMARRREAGVVLHSPPKGPPHYVVYVPLTMPAGWGLLLEQPEDVVVAIPQHLRRWMIGVGVTILLAGTLVAWLDVRRVTRPLHVLTAAAGRIGGGDLATPVTVAGNDEVGILGRTVEDMRIRLRRSLEEIQEKAQTVATLRERERIARELHDGLAQALATVYSVAGAGKLRLGKQNHDGVGQSLDEILTLSRQAYEEVRQSIFGLRTMVARGLGLVPAIAEYLHEFSERSGIPVQLIVEDEGATQLTPPVEAQLIRIIQEALTNVWRHAHAQRAVIEFTHDDGMIRVAVQDDGVGFAGDGNGAEGERHFGLQTMRERAEGVGGSFRVTSVPGHGTRVEVRLPVGAGGEERWIPSA